MPPGHSLVSSPRNLPSGKYFPYPARQSSHPPPVLSMVNTFHLHICGNSRDFSEFYVPLRNDRDSPFRPKACICKYLHGDLKLQLWHFVCSQRTSSTVLKGDQWRVNFLRLKIWCPPPLNSGKPPASASKSPFSCGVPMRLELASLSSPRRSISALPELVLHLHIFFNWNSLYSSRFPPHRHHQTWFPTKLLRSPPV